MRLDSTMLVFSNIRATHRIIDKVFSKLQEELEFKFKARSGFACVQDDLSWKAS